jgi:hypothetical protein
MNGIEREYEYRSHFALIIGCALFFGLGAIVLAAKAATNDHGVIINSVVRVTLGPVGATVFYWFLSLFSTLLFLAILRFHRVIFRQRLAFGPATLIVPVSRWNTKEKEIAYQDIEEISTTQVSGRWVLDIHHRGGKFTIAASMLSSREAFDELRELLAAKCPGKERW